MSYQAMAWATKQRVGDPALKLLLLVLANYANEEGELWHSQQRISFDTEIPTRTLRRKFSTLVEAGFITVTERRRDDGSRMTSLVRLLADQQPAKMADCTSGQNSKRPKEGVTSGQKGGSPAANMVAAYESKETHESSMLLTHASRADDWPDDYVDVFWNAYPPVRRTAKKTVAAKLATIRRKREVTFRRLMDGLEAYKATDPGDYTRAPTVWLNGGCWDDVHTPRAPKRQSSGNGFAQLLRDRQQARVQEGFAYDDDGHGPIIDADPVADPGGFCH